MAANHKAAQDELVGPLDLTDEEYREYEFTNGQIYRIENPVSLYLRKGGTTHRVVDREGVTHCVIGPSEGGVVLRWKTRQGTDPVAF